MRIDCTVRIWSLHQTLIEVELTVLRCVLVWVVHKIYTISLIKVGSTAFGAQPTERRFAYCNFFVWWIFCVQYCHTIRNILLVIIKCSTIGRPPQIRPRLNSPLFCVFVYLKKLCYLLESIFFFHLQRNCDIAADSKGAIATVHLFINLLKVIIPNGLNDTYILFIAIEKLARARLSRFSLWYIVYRMDFFPPLVGVCFSHLFCERVFAAERRYSVKFKPDRRLKYTSRNWVVNNC